MKIRIPATFRVTPNYEVQHVPSHTIERKYEDLLNEVMSWMKFTKEEAQEYISKMDIVND